MTQFVDEIWGLNMTKLWYNISNLYKIIILLADLIRVLNLWVFPNLLKTSKVLNIGHVMINNVFACRNLSFYNILYICLLIWIIMLLSIYTVRWILSTLTVCRSFSHDVQYFINLFIDSRLPILFYLYGPMDTVHCILSSFTHTYIYWHS